MRRATVWLRAAAGAVGLSAEIYPSEKDQSSCGKEDGYGREWLSSPFVLPVLGQSTAWKPPRLQGTEENGSIVSCPSASLVSLGQERLRSLNQGKKKEHANLQQTELLKSGGFANHSLFHLWFF